MYRLTTNNNEAQRHRSHHHHHQQQHKSRAIHKTSANETSFSVSKTTENYSTEENSSPSNNDEGASSSATMPASSSMFRSKQPPIKSNGVLGSTSSFATREIAALDFLLNIPLETERSIVRAGLGQRVIVDLGETSNSTKALNALDPTSQSSRWYDEFDPMTSNQKTVEDMDKESDEAEELDGPDGGKDVGGSEYHKQRTTTMTTTASAPPGRRLDGTHATVVRVPMELLWATGNSNGTNASAATTRTAALRSIMDSASLSIDSNSVNAAPNGTDATGHRTQTQQTPHSVSPWLRQRAVGRQATIRQWEMRVALGILPFADTSSPGVKTNNSLGNGQGLLDGRAFLSSDSSYPMGIFSVIKYEPKKEEAARRRKKLEELGGGGTQFVVPMRDWRGISYRALLPRVEKKNKAFNRRLTSKRIKRKNSLKRDIPSIANKKIQREGKGDKFSVVVRHAKPEENSRDIDDATSDLSDEDETVATSSSSSSEQSDAYVPGFLDDPSMVQGRHRHVMVGDQVTGCVVSSTIQFVKPVDLKADLNKQFKERFEGWEPPKEQWKFIGAKVIDGVYTLMDGTESNPSPPASNASDDQQRIEGGVFRDNRPFEATASSSAVTPSASPPTELEAIRMPPSLTLSKIRSVKQQALRACIRAKLEISTVALACLYFERLCLDCRVDKSNRRLSFAACLLLATKMNEANDAIVHDRRNDENDETSSKNNPKIRVLPSRIKRTKKSGNIFASLLEFFTHDWSLTLKQLSAAEWGVFAALGFRLHATPSQVAFHFKRLMKGLEWNVLSYLGSVMYDQWQECLVEESRKRDVHLKRRKQREQRKERKLMELQRELAASKNRLSPAASYSGNSSDDEREKGRSGQYDTGVLLPPSSLVSTSLQHGNGSSGDIVLHGTSFMGGSKMFATNAMSLLKRKTQERRASYQTNDSHSTIGGEQQQTPLQQYESPQKQTKGSVVVGMRSNGGTPTMGLWRRMGLATKPNQPMGGGLSPNLSKSINRENSGIVSNMKRSVSSSVLEKSSRTDLSMQSLSSLTSRQDRNLECLDADTDAGLDLEKGE